MNRGFIYRSLLEYNEGANMDARTLQLIEASKNIIKYVRISKQGVIPLPIFEDVALIDSIMQEVEQAIYEQECEYNEAMLQEHHDWIINGAGDY